MAKKLTNKQLLFVAHYLVCWNATKAAILAGYSANTAYSIGWENLRKPEIAALVKQKMTEQVMSSDEVLARLSQMASGNLIDILSDDDEFDLTVAREKNMTHLVKKIKRRQFTDKDGNTTRETEIELHDAQAALVHLGKHYKLFANVVQVETWRDKLVDGLRKGIIKPDDVLKEFDRDLATELFNAAGISVSQGGEAARTIPRVSPQVALAALAPRPVGYSDTPGENQDDSDGSAVG